MVVSIILQALFDGSRLKGGSKVAVGEDRAPRSAHVRNSNSLDDGERCSIERERERSCEMSSCDQPLKGGDRHYRFNSLSVLAADRHTKLVFSDKR